MPLNDTSFVFIAITFPHNFINTQYKKLLACNSGSICYELIIMVPMNTLIFLIRITNQTFLSW